MQLGFVAVVACSDAGQPGWRSFLNTELLYLPAGLLSEWCILVVYLGGEDGRCTGVAGRCSDVDGRCTGVAGRWPGVKPERGV